MGFFCDFLITVLSSSFSLFCSSKHLASFVCYQMSYHCQILRYSVLCVISVMMSLSKTENSLSLSVCTMSIINSINRKFPRQWLAFPFSFVIIFFRLIRKHIPCFAESQSSILWNDAQYLRTWLSLETFLNSASAFTKIAFCGCNSVSSVSQLRS